MSAESPGESAVNVGGDNSPEDDLVERIATYLRGRWMKGQQSCQDDINGTIEFLRSLPVDRRMEAMGLVLDRTEGDHACISGVWFGPDV